MVSVMDPPVSGSAPAALGEDLFLLSIRRPDGKLLTRGRIDSALMASELIRLAAAGRAWIDEGRVVARDQTATGDPELDAALLSLAGVTSPPRPETWVGLPRRGIRAAYAARLTSAGALRLESSRVLGTPRYRVTDAARMAGARSRLDAAVQSAGTLTAGTPADLVSLALAALASPIGLGDVLYPGREGRVSRTRMAQIARQQVITRARAGSGTGSGGAPPAGPVIAWAAGDAAGEPARESAGEGGPGPASLLVLEEVIAAAVHALTAVIEDGTIVASEVAGTRIGGIQIPGAHGAADR
jgi:hypothetical protein